MTPPRRTTLAASLIFGSETRQTLPRFVIILSEGTKQHLIGYRFSRSPLPMSEEDQELDDEEFEDDGWAEESEEEEF